jgi:hypothetical protein
MIANRVECKWEITNDRVLFSVCEPYEHRLCCFLNDYCEKNKKQPSLSEWLSFYKKAGAPKIFIDAKIKLFNKNKKNQEKMQLLFDKMYSKDVCTGPKKAKKVVIKKSG